MSEFSHNTEPSRPKVMEVSTQTSRQDFVILELINCGNGEPVEVSPRSERDLLAEIDALKEALRIQSELMLKMNNKSQNNSALLKEQQNKTHHEKKSQSTQPMMSPAILGSCSQNLVPIYPFESAELAWEEFRSQLPPRTRPPQNKCASLSNKIQSVVELTSHPNISAAQRDLSVVRSLQMSKNDTYENNCSTLIEQHSSNKDATMRSFTKARSRPSKQIPKDISQSNWDWCDGKAGPTIEKRRAQQKPQTISPPKKVPRRSKEKKGNEKDGKAGPTIEKRRAQQKPQTISPPKKVPRRSKEKKGNEKVVLAPKLLPTQLLALRKCVPNLIAQPFDFEKQMVSIGPNNTQIPSELYESMYWKVPRKVTRDLLESIFDPETLAKHEKLDPRILDDIAYVVTHKCKITENTARQILNDLLAWTTII